MQLGSAQSVANTTLISIEIQFWVAFADNSLHWYLITFRVFRVWVKIRVKVIVLYILLVKKVMIIWMCRPKGTVYCPEETAICLEETWVSYTECTFIYDVEVTSGLWLKKDFKIEAVKFPMVIIYFKIIFFYFVIPTRNTDPHKFTQSNENYARK